MELNHDDCGITDVRVVDFFAIRVEFDGWVFPRSSVAFVWRHAPATLQPRKVTTK